MAELKNYLKDLEGWLKNYLEESKQKTYILGISGGIDSAVCAALAKNAVGKDRLHCVLIPIESDSVSVDDALLVVQHLDVNYTFFDATEIYKKYVEDYKSAGIELTEGLLGNLKARIRMNILYSFAQDKHGLVIGTDNAAEYYVGYFTKYGDGGCDLLPLRYLLKREVFEAAKLLGLPQKIIDKIPSAELYPGQTDEIELGFTYSELDDYLEGKDVGDLATRRIKHWHEITEHKRKKIPSPGLLNKSIKRETRDILDY